MSDDKKLDARIRAIMGRIFEVRPEDVTEKTRRGELERWDSLSHLALLTAIQEEFQIDIPPDQALEMGTLEDIRRTVISARGSSSSS
jgi:acyl carrier protein